MRVRLTSGVVCLGAPHEAGEVLDLPALDARYLVGGGRAEYVEAPAAPKAAATPVKSRVLPEAQAPIEPPAVSAPAAKEVEAPEPPARGPAKAKGK